MEVGFELWNPDKKISSSFLFFFFSPFFHNLFFCVFAFLQFFGENSGVGSFKQELVTTKSLKFEEDKANFSTPLLVFEIKGFLKEEEEWKGLREKRVWRGFLLSFRFSTWHVSSIHLKMGGNGRDGNWRWARPYNFICTFSKKQHDISLPRVPWLKNNIW